MRDAASSNGWPCRVDASGAIPLPVSLHIVTQICDALDYAHNMTDEHGEPLGIIHRDVSPPNIIISNTGTVKLIDFGLAKASRSSVQTQVGTIKGKFSYIAPEYLRGQLDVRCDVWSLGVVAWELLTMQRLFDSKDDLDVLGMVKDMPIVPPSRHARDIPGELDAINALAKQYGNVTVMPADLSAFKLPEPVDLVWTTENYHDFHNGPTANVAGLNGAVFAALKPGGTYFVEDHAAVAGAPMTTTSTLHRIDPATAISEIEAAGFKLDAQSKALANPKDTKELGVRDPSIQGETEKFALRFKKPG